MSQLMQHSHWSIKGLHVCLLDPTASIDAVICKVGARKHLQLCGADVGGFLVLSSQSSHSGFSCLHSVGSICGSCLELSTEVSHPLLRLLKLLLTSSKLTCLALQPPPYRQPSESICRKPGRPRIVKQCIKLHVAVHIILQQQDQISYCPCCTAELTTSCELQYLCTAYIACRYSAGADQHCILVALTAASLLYVITKAYHAKSRCFGGGGSADGVIECQEVKKTLELQLLASLEMSLLGYYLCLSHS